MRTVETLDAQTAVIAVLAAPDWVADADAVLDEIESTSAAVLSREPLPAVCREDWFLETWINESEAEGG